MKKKIVLMLIAILLMNCKIFSQNSPLSNQQIIPPPPDAASLGKFVNVTIGYQNGTFTVSVPIWEVKAKGLSIPISLNYHGSGVRVEELASRVGLGWALNAGGVITRVVRGLPDDNENSGTGYRSSPMLERKDTYTVEENHLLLDFVDGYYDSEPDIFIYKFAEYSGKFVVDKNGEAFMLPYNNQIKIKKQDSYNLGYWEIETTDGAKYYFNNIEKNLKCIIGITDAFSSTPLTHKSSWFLSKIITSKSDTISFNYTTNEVNYQSGFTETQYWNNCCPVDCDNVHKNSCAVGGSPIQKSCMYNSVLSQDIASISVASSGEKVNFKQGKNRFDLYPGSSVISCQPVLGSIAIINFLSDTITQFKMEYSYNGVGINMNPATGDQFNNRLFLNRVTEINKGRQKAPYQFEYFSGLPARNSCAIDDWGYYNGQISNISYIRRDNSQYSSYSDANKQPSEQFAKSGAMSKVTYPTGGNSQFDYELNYSSSANIYSDTINNWAYGPNITNSSTSFTITNLSDNSYVDIGFGAAYNAYDSNWKLNILDQNNNPVYNAKDYRIDNGFSMCHLKLANGTYHVDVSGIPPTQYYSFTAKWHENIMDDSRKIAGGLRIKKITHYDPLNNQTITNSIVYSGLGIVDNYGYYATSKWKFYEAWQGVYCSLAEVKCDNIITRTSYPAISVLYASGSNIYYNQVEEYNGTPTLNTGKTKYTFNTDIGNLGFPMSPCGYTTPFLNYIWNVGLPTGVYKYDNNNTIVYLKNIEYQRVGIDQGNISAFQVIPKYIGSLKGYWGSIVDQTCPIFYKIYTDNLLKSKEEEIFYYSNKQSISNSSNYKYNNYQFLVSQTTSNSNGDVIVKKIKYPSDYSITDPVITKMKTQFVIGQPVESQTWKNGLLVEGYTNKFGEVSPNVFMPTQVYRLATPTPLTTIDMDDDLDKLTYTKMNTDGYYHLAGELTYGLYGNESKFNKINDVKTAYVWGYNNTYPIVKAENINNTDLTAAVNSASSNNIQGTLINIGDMTTSVQKNTWQAFNTTLRSTLPANTMVTTYTYKPLVGITSQTDPNGVTTYYEYDCFGRLKLIKDKDGNILKTYDYHYQGQQ